MRKKCVCMRESNEGHAGRVDVLLGLQWGDEGKGKVVDVLAKQYNVIARFQGGPNAGHSLVFGKEKFVLHTIPSGIFRKSVQNIVASGVVVDPVSFQQEVLQLQSTGVDVRSQLKLSRRAHLILPTHKLLDAFYEKQKGNQKIGSTLKGIGPTYTDKTARNGLRIGDVNLPNFKQKYEALKAHHLCIIGNEIDTAALAEAEKRWFEAIEVLKQYEFIDSEYLVNKYLSQGVDLLAEGAQGSMLDVDFGSYPFVTSSNTICAGACTGMGVAPRRIGRVYGIFKAYCTRVGAGPFPTELHDALGEKMRVQGQEFGATTGRPRRCGWLDMVALKYAIMLNGVTHLIMTKADVLSNFETIRVCTSYTIDGVASDHVPFAAEQEVGLVYRDFKGWQEDISTCKTYEELPAAFKEFMNYIEQETGVPIAIVSLGPDRDDTLIRSLA